MGLKRMFEAASEKWYKSKLSVDGAEVNSGLRRSASVKFRKPETIEDRVIMAMRSEEFRKRMEQSGFETFEEADDFDVGDFDEKLTPYEEGFDPQRERNEQLAQLTEKDQQLQTRFAKTIADQLAKVLRPQEETESPTKAAPVTKKPQSKAVNKSDKSVVEKSDKQVDDYLG